MPEKGTLALRVCNSLGPWQELSGWSSEGEALTEASSRDRRRESGVAKENSVEFCALGWQRNRGGIWQRVWV